MSSVEKLDELLKGCQLLFVSGKGGVGKTLFAGAVAKYYHSKGLRVLTVESAPRAALPTLLWRMDETPAEDPASQERWSADGLGHCNLSLKGNLRDYIAKHLRMPQLADFLGNQKIAQSFFHGVPGFGELLTLGRIFYGSQLAPEPRPDLIVFDSFASGHFVSLLTTPDAILRSGLSGPIIKETQRVRDFLSSSKCGVIYNLIPEELSVSETIDFLPKLVAQVPVAVRGLFINGVFDASSEPLSDGDVLGEFAARRAAREKTALNNLNQWLSESPFAGKVLQGRALGFVDEPLETGFLQKWLL